MVSATSACYKRLADLRCAMMKILTKKVALIPCYCLYYFDDSEKNIGIVVLRIRHNNFSQDDDDDDNVEGSINYLVIIWFILRFHHLNQPLIPIERSKR